MISRKISLGGAVPFSAARAHQVVALANNYASSVILQDSRGTFNGKSLLGILSLGKLSGREMVLLVEGRDEEAAAEALAAILQEEGQPAPS